MNQAILDRNERIISRVGSDRFRQAMVAAQVAVRFQSSERDKIEAVLIDNSSDPARLGFTVKHEGAPIWEMVENIQAAIAKNINVDVTGWEITTIGNIEIEIKLIRLEQ